MGQTLHKLDLSERNERFAEWFCPLCNRRLRVYYKGELEILHAGNQYVSHGSAMTVPCAMGIDVFAVPEEKIH